MMIKMIRGRDGGTNFIMRIKVNATRLTVREYDDDDDEDDPRKRWREYFILWIQEKETRLIFQEHDDDDEDDDPKKKWRDQINLQDQGTGNTHNTLGIL